MTKSQKAVKSEKKRLDTGAIFVVAYRVR